MPGIGLIAAVAMTLLGAEPLWPDLAALPAVTGGGEKDAAVVVAVEDYVFLPDVVGAGDLGVAWYMYLSKVRKVPLVMLLKDADATPIKIRNALEAVAGRVKPGGRAWFVFIGHGSPSKDGADGALVGATAQADQYEFFPQTITRGEVLQKLAAAAPGAAAPVLILDACFSGTDVQGQALIAGAQFAVSQEIAEAKEATVLSAGRARDIAGQLPGARRPAFSYLVLGALRGWGDFDDDGVVTAAEAAQYARDVLLTLDSGRQQSPQQSGVDQPMTEKLSGSALEHGPDLADIRLKLAGGGSTAVKVQDDLAAELAALEKARREREDAEKREVAAREAARTKHEAEVEETWKTVKQVAVGGGPEGTKAVELFLKRYQGHPLGNPKETEARQMLEKLGAVASAALTGYILVKPGCFQMGSPATEDGRDSSEVQHEVCITKGFYLKETEVTQKEWRDVMGSNPSHFVACGDRCPVENVSWWDAVAYANALSKKEGLELCYTMGGCTGSPGGGCGKGRSWCDGDYQCRTVAFKGLACKGYRLPTEAEWEYAARAGNTSALHGALDDVAWYNRNSGNKTQPVGYKKANFWGFSDVVGNVWEWCWDWYGAYDGTRNDPLGTAAGGVRMYRGGSWYSYPNVVRFATRRGQNPKERYDFIGLRLARSQ